MEVVLHLSLQNLGEKDRDCSQEWLVNTDPDRLNRMVKLIRNRVAFRI